MARLGLVLRRSQRLVRARCEVPAWCQEFFDAGFLIERLVEPQPAATMADRYPEVRQRLEHSPGFVGFSLLKP